MDLFAGFDRPWWLIGGYAIEAFTGSLREHEDIDVSVLACDAPLLREHVGDRWDLWTNVSGRIRPMTERWPDLPEPDCQIWLRKDWSSPWVMDLPVTPDVDGLWQNKRLPDHVAPLDEVTWVTDEGVRVLDPEIVLLFKSDQRPRQGPPRPRPGPASARPCSARLAARGHRSAAARPPLVGRPRNRQRRGAVGGVMRRRGVLLVVPLLLGASACTTSTSTSTSAGGPDAGAAVSPAPGTPPTWAACKTHSMQSIDYAADAPGAPSLADALAPYRKAGDHVVRRPRQPHRNPAWLLVDEHNVIRSALEVWHTRGGWLVGSVDRCAD